MLIKGYVVPLRAQGLGSRTSERARKSLDNSSFKMSLYISGRSWIAVDCNKCHLLVRSCHYKCLLVCTLSQVLIYMHSAISPIVISIIIIFIIIIRSIYTRLKLLETKNKLNKFSQIWETSACTKQYSISS